MRNRVSTVGEEERKKLFENLAQIIDGEEEELDTCFRSKKI